MSAPMVERPVCAARTTRRDYVTLAQSSLSNDILSAYAVADEASGLIVLPIFVKDGLGTTLASSDAAWVKKVADTSLARGHEPRVVFECSPLELQVGVTCELDIQERTIDGIAFKVSQLPATRAFHVLHRLGKVVSPALSKAASALSPGAGLEGINLSDLASALETFFTSCTTTDLDYFIEQLLFNAVADDALLKPVFEVKLQGKMGTLLQLLYFAVEVNFSDFSDLCAASSRRLKRKQAQARP